jgi:hypothetical protein
MTGGPESVEVVGALTQTGEFYVHAMRRFGSRRGHSTLHDVVEPLIARHFPFDVDPARRHAAESVVGQRIRREPRPYHHTIGGGLTGRHPERERIGSDGTGAAVGGESRDRQCREHQRTLENGTATRMYRHGRVSESRLSSR